ncbi:MAG: hypothetical protein H8D61_01265 [Deltaproteobacteria bacterium]|nr:hypothetical protein [Deltaproteobacteria bacterium]
MALSSKKKYEHILARERAIAASVARATNPPKPFSVWEFMIPVIFILTFMKNKQTRELFIQNFLFTKKLALQAAFNMIAKGWSRGKAKAQIEQKTGLVLEGENRDIYSDKIRREQFKEIELLIDHYAKLLTAEGNDYGSLVLCAYAHRENYQTFLVQLESAEKAVFDAARQTLAENVDFNALSKIESATQRARTAEVEKIFHA